MGLDLMFQGKASEQFDLQFVGGRNAHSDGLRLARSGNVETSSDGLDFLTAHEDADDLVFDATSAAAHKVNNRCFSDAGTFVIDLTPAKVGRLCV
ncbi:acetaldehyde dehydrogenase (acetylating), partial [Burkholderia pseudomallei]